MRHTLLALALLGCGPAPVYPDAGMPAPDASVPTVDAQVCQGDPLWSTHDACRQFYRLAWERCGGPALDLCPWHGYPCESAPAGTDDVLAVLAETESCEAFRARAGEL